MKDIEEAFQPLADRISGGLTSLGVADQAILTKFFALWILRQHYDQNRLQDLTINGIAGELFTEERQDRLEAQGGASTVSGKPTPARFITGLMIQMQLDEIFNRFQGKSWGIVTALGGEFLCPDTYGDCPVIPISPKVCLFGGKLDAQLSKAAVAKVNQFAQQNTRRYCFARDFAACPI